MKGCSIWNGLFLTHPPAFASASADRLAPSLKIQRRGIDPASKLLKKRFWIKFAT